MCEYDKIDIAFRSIGSCGDYGKWQEEHCQCDPSVGMVPCHYCAVFDALTECVKTRLDCVSLKKALEEKGEKLAESEGLRVKHLETIVRRENQLGELEKHFNNWPLDKRKSVEVLNGRLQKEIVTLKKALEEAKKEVEELRYRFRLIGIDNPLPKQVPVQVWKKKEEEKHYKSPLHYCPHGIRITETCADCGRKE